MSDYRLDGRVALVTGASRGIGRAVALELAAAGAAVAVTSRQHEGVAGVRAEVEALGARAYPVALEVTDPESSARAVAEVEERFGPIDVLVNNAGVQRLRTAFEVRPEDWDYVLDANLRGLFFCCQAAGRGMVERRRGVIVNISSAAGLIPVHERAAYCTSKAGVIMLTKVLALEWAEYGVTVNAVAPTFVDTELARQTFARPGAWEAVRARIPLGRIATVEDVAAAVRYLASPAGSFVTGQTIGVDGGLTMR